MQNLELCFSIILLLYYCAGIIQSVPIEYYDSKIEHIDIDRFLGNKRLVQNYADCLLSKKPCAPQGKEIRDILPEAIQTNCERCTEKQKIGAMRVIHTLQKNYPTIWAELSERWDPTGENVRRFEESFNTIGNKLERSPPVNTTTTATPAASNNEIALGNRFGDAPSSINNGDLDQSNFVNSTTRSTTQAVFTTRSSMSSSTVVPTFRPVAFPLMKPNWLDKLGSHALKTAGRIADMFVSTIEGALSATKLNNM